MRITDSQGYPVIKTTDDFNRIPDFKLKAEIPADLTFAFVDQESKMGLDVTTFEFRIITKHTLPKGAVVDIEWP